MAKTFLLNRSWSWSSNLLQVSSVAKWMSTNLLQVNSVVKWISAELTFIAGKLGYYSFSTLLFASSAELEIL